jgi:hypothetical protein
MERNHIEVTPREDNMYEDLVDRNKTPRHHRYGEFLNCSRIALLQANTL